MICIAFSGGCLSGKTATMNIVSDMATAKGFEVVKLSEIIRSVLKPTASIDVLRKNAKEYLAFEISVISEKINAEINAYKKYRDNDKAVILIDRAITDSMFYYMHYLQYSELDIENVKKANDFLLEIEAHMRCAFEDIYSYIFEFTPLDIENDDSLRPANIDKTKYVEHSYIHALNNMATCRGIEHKMIYFNLNCYENLEYLRKVVCKMLNNNGDIYI